MGMNEDVMDEFRANDGKVGGFFENIPLLILHHTGAKTGSHYEMPLAFLQDGDRMVIFASNGGAATHPHWYHNLIAHPEVKVELGGGKTVEAKAVVTRGAESVRLYDAQVAVMPLFGEYREKANREIPVVALEPV